LTLIDPGQCAVLVAVVSTHLAHTCDKSFDPETAIQHLCQVEVHYTT